MFWNGCIERWPATRGGFNSHLPAASAAFWRISTYLLAGSPALCNLPSHSSLLTPDCLRLKSHFGAGAVLCSAAWPSLSEPHRGHQRSRELWLRFSLIWQTPFCPRWALHSDCPCVRWWKWIAPSGDMSVLLRRAHHRCSVHITLSFSLEHHRFPAG